MCYLLDTCALIWLASDQSYFTDNAKNMIRRNAENLYVSAIFAFEIAIKSKKGRIELPLSPDVWFREVIKHHGLNELPVTSEIASYSTLLPMHHNDPCDRIIIATALLKNMSVITKDNTFSKHSDLKLCW